MGELMGMTAREFDGWKRFDAVEPIGEVRGDLRAAQVVATLLNLHRDPTKRPEPFALEDVLLFREPDPEPTPEELAAKLDAAFGAMAGG